MYDCAKNIRDVKMAKIDDKDRETDPKVIRMEQRESARDCNLLMSDNSSNKHVAPTGITKSASIDQSVAIHYTCEWNVTKYTNKTICKI